MQLMARVLVQAKAVHSNLFKLRKTWRKARLQRLYGCMAHNCHAMPHLQNICKAHY